MKRNRLVKKNSFRGELKKMGQNPILKLDEYSSHFMNPQGKQCRLIQKRNLCLCGHRYEVHTYHESHSLHCANLGCNCKHFQFIPDISVKCLCKHSHLAHTKENRKCEKCQNCLGFSTDMFCKCGYRFMQHNNHIVLKPNKENQTAKSSKNNSLPLICKSSYDYLPKGHDHVVQKLSQSMLQEKIIEKEAKQYNEKLENSEYYHQEYLKEKLRQANKRYFARFTQPEKKQEQDEKIHETTAFDLYIRPHLYRNISLTKFIKETLHR